MHGRQGHSHHLRLQRQDHLLRPSYDPLTTLTTLFPDTPVYTTFQLFSGKLFDMGIVCSCLASTFLLLGEVCSTLFLAIGEVGAMLIRGMFSLIVGLCDVLAACACCCRVPFSDRPDRGGYTYTTLALRTDAPAQHRLMDKPKFSSKSFAAHRQLFSVPALKHGRKTKADPSANADTAAIAEINIATTAIEDVAKHSTDSTANTEKVAEHETPQSSWYTGWFGSGKPAIAA